MEATVFAISAKAMPCFMQNVLGDVFDSDLTKTIMNPKKTMIVSMVEGN